MIKKGPVVDYLVEEGYLEVFTKDELKLIPKVKYNEKNSTKFAGEKIICPYLYKISQKSTNAGWLAARIIRFTVLSNSEKYTLQETDRRRFASGVHIFHTFPW